MKKALTAGKKLTKKLEKAFEKAQFKNPFINMKKLAWNNNNVGEIGIFKDKLSDPQTSNLNDQASNQTFGKLNY